jgi:hypothetical protein
MSALFVHTRVITSRWLGRNGVFDKTGERPGHCLDLCHPSNVVIEREHAHIVGGIYASANMNVRDRNEDLVPRFPLNTSFFGSTQTPAMVGGSKSTSEMVDPK